MLLTANYVFFTNAGLAQVADQDPDEVYCRTHISYSGFCQLGISQTTYAKAMKSQNHFEPDKKTHKFVIDGEEYLDNGEGNDLVRDDGILTSVVTYNYAKGESIIPVGQYRQNGNHLVLTDPLFSHTGSISPDFIRVSCEMIWVSCSSWPQQYRQVCLDFSWPFRGYLHATRCRVIVGL